MINITHSSSTMFVYPLLTVVIATASYMHTVSSSIPLKFNGKLFFKYIPSASVTDEEETFNNNNNNNNNNNKIDFRFRTLYPSGLFVLLTGQHKDEVLFVELVQGFLRWINFLLYSWRKIYFILVNNFFLNAYIFF